MSHDRITILSVIPRGKAPAVDMGGVTFFEAAAMPEMGALLSEPWDYVHLGFDCAVLDARIFAVVAEHAYWERPDMLAVSTPAARFPTCLHERRGDIFNALCLMGRKGTLYAPGNKFLSRDLVGRLSAPPVTPLLTMAFREVSRLGVLSHPWIETEAPPSPTDEEFFGLTGHFAEDGDGC